MPHKPQLVRGQNEELCRPFAQMWQFNFRTVKTVSEASIEPSKFFTDSSVISLGEGGIYGTAYIFQAQFGGKQRQFLLQSKGRGWRYIGAKLSIVKNEKLLLEYIDGDIKDGVIGHEKMRGLEEKNRKEWYGELEDLPPAQRFHFINKDERLYFVTPQYSLKEMGTQSETDTCKMQMREDKKYKNFFTEEEVDNFRNLRGGPGRPCAEGTLGPHSWARRKWEDFFYVILDRPWVIQNYPKHDNRAVNAPIQWKKTELESQLRLYQWGLEDPISWQVALDIDNGRHDILARLSAYYMQYFSYTKQDAEIIARKAYL
jgi:hypothetical protein